MHIRCAHQVYNGNHGNSGHLVISKPHVSFSCCILFTNKNSHESLPRSCNGGMQIRRRNSIDPQLNPQMKRHKVFNYHGPTVQVCLIYFIVYNQVFYCKTIFTTVIQLWIIKKNYWAIKCFLFSSARSVLVLFTHVKTVHALLALFTRKFVNITANVSDFSRYKQFEFLKSYWNKLIFNIYLHKLLPAWI